MKPRTITFVLLTFLLALAIWQYTEEAKLIHAFTNGMLQKAVVLDTYCTASTRKSSSIDVVLTDKRNTKVYSCKLYNEACDLLHKGDTLVIKYSSAEDMTVWPNAAVSTKGTQFWKVTMVIIGIAFLYNLAAAIYFKRKG